MDNDKLIQFGKMLVETFYGDKVVPFEILQKFGSVVSNDNKQYIKSLIDLWNKISDEKEKNGKAPRDIKIPLILSRGYADILPEDELSKYLPEEKILINKDIFRDKLKDIDFSKINAPNERKIIEELKSEAIGLNGDDVVLYYNMIKINYLSANMKGGQESQKTAIETDFDYPASILKLFEQEFELNSPNFIKINDLKQIHPVVAKEILNQKFKTGKANPKVVSVMLGSGTKKFVTFMKEFIKLTAFNRDNPFEEYIYYLCAFILLNGGDEKLLNSLQMSTKLYTFINENLGRVPVIYNCAIIFIYNFMLILVTLILELNNKYKTSDDEQKEKVFKLYNSEERINMLLNNATNLALSKISKYKTESREIQLNIKNMLDKNKKFLTTKELFEVDYI